MIFLGAVVFGIKSYQELALNLMPDLSYPTLTVRTEYPEAAPEEVENFVSRPLEEALSTVSSLVEIRSMSSAGLSEVVLEFMWGTDMNFVSLDVREKMDRVFLPDEVDRPTILRYNPALDPILQLGLYGEQDLFMLRRIAEKEIKPRVEGLPGVASVKIKGGMEEEVLVEVDEGRLARLGITMEQVTQRLWQENINLAGGSLKEGRAEYLVRTLNEFYDLRDIGEVVVGRKGGDGRGDGAGALGGGSVLNLMKLGSAVAGGEAEIRLRDVADIRWGNKKQDVVTRIDGLDSVEIEIYKEADSNTVQVAERVKKTLGLDQPEAGKRQRENAPKGIMQRIEEDYPGIQLRIISDPARFIQRALDQVSSTAVFGGILALLVLYLFLRDVKSTAIIGVSIPVSIFLAFIPMFIFDISLNMMSLGGLALGIGMLVDDSIVVLESIFRCREEGDGVVEAANRGMNEVSSAITASTLTTIAVFFPIVFVKGIAGQLFNDLALTVTFSLLGSLLVALYLIPMLASRGAGVGVGLDRAGKEGEDLRGLLASQLRQARQWLGENARPGRWMAEAREFLRGGWLRRLYGVFHPLFELSRLVLGAAFGLVVGILELAVILLGRVLAPVFSLVVRLVHLVSLPALIAFEKLMEVTSRLYPPLVRQALAHRGTVVILSVLLFAHSVYLLPRLGTELIPRIHQGQFTLRIERPVGTPLEQTSEAVKPVEALALEDPLTETVFSEIGSEPSGGEAVREQAGENTAELTITLKDTGKAAYQEDALIDRLRDRLKDFVGFQTKFELPTLFSFKTPVEVEIEGNDLQNLRRISREVEKRMQTVEGLADIRSSAGVGNPEVHIRFDRERLSQFGLDVNKAARIVQAKLLGEVPTRLSEGETRYDIRVRVDRTHLRSLEDLEGLRIELASGSFVPLSSLAHMRVVPGPSEIRRVAQRRVAVVSANLKGTDLGTVSREIMERLGRMPLPPGYRVSLGGQNREMQSSFDSLRFAMLLAVFLVYIVMACQFESLRHPFVILFSIPLGLIGVVYSLYLLSIPLSVVVFIGVIMLAGIMVNDAIVLVDYVNVLRRRGVPREEAIVQSGQVRLRPILMTTLTTVLGLLPMALGLGEGAEIRAPMAITVIAGLMCSTVLTLVVIPVVYSLMDRKE